MNQSPADNLAVGNLNPYSIKNMWNASMMWLIQMLEYANQETNVVTILNREVSVDTKSLNLSGKDLKTLPAEVMKLKELKKLNLSNNNISELHSTFDDLSKLERLDLGSNKLTQLPKNVFFRLNNLKTLNLYRNRLEELPKSINRLTSLKELNLELNQLKEIPLIGLSCLKILNMSHNCLNKLPETLVTLTSLGELNLEYNKLKTVSASTFKGLHSLRMLKINNNQLEKIELRDLPALQKLDLQDNHLSRVTLDDSMKNLVEMNLSKNKLDKISEDIGKHGMLARLNLRSNRLVYLPRSIEKLSSLVELDLRGNPDIIYSSDDENKLGRLELVELFGSKVLLDEIKFKDLIFDEEDFIEEYNLRPLYWNLDGLSELRIDQVPETRLTANQMIAIINKVSMKEKTYVNVSGSDICKNDCANDGWKSDLWKKILGTCDARRSYIWPRSSNDRQSLISRDEADTIIDYIRMLYNPSRRYYDDGELKPSYILYLKNLLGYFLENLDQMIGCIRIDFFLCSLSRIARSTRCCPEKQVAALTDAYTIIQHDLSQQSRELDDFIKRRIAVLKECYFRVLMVPVMC